MFPHYYYYYYRNHPILSSSLSSVSLGRRSMMVRSLNKATTTTTTTTPIRILLNGNNNNKNSSRSFIGRSIASLSLSSLPYPQQLSQYCYHHSYIVPPSYNTNYSLRTFASSSSSSLLQPPVYKDTRFLDTTKQPPIYKLYTNNEFVVSEGNATLPVTNPGTGHIIGYVPETTNTEFTTIVEQSDEAFQLWKRIPVQHRQRILFKYLNLLHQYEQELITSIVLENGKTIADAKGDIFRGIEVVESACNAAPHLLGDTLSGLSNTSTSATTVETISYKEPLGVCAGICPFNFPAMIPLWMFPLAIVAGNTFILKPSEKTPGTAMLLVDLLHRAGLPKNVVQIVHGSHDCVNQICTHPTIQTISFVGSNIAGEYIYQLGSSHNKRVQSNLGAKNHAVVMTDELDTDGAVDRTATINAIVGAAFGAAGQRCMALSVLVVVGTDQTKIQSFITDIVQQAQTLHVGVGWDPKTDIGPVITTQSKERIQSILQQSMNQGGRIHLDGRQHPMVMANTEGGGGNGNFIGPSVVQVPDITNVAYTDEIFGPVLTCVVVPTIDDAITVINNNPYGNGGCLFTNHGPLAKYFVASVNIGQIGINVPLPVPLPMFSFTGNKRSIRGDINFYGKSGIQFYTQTKTVTSHWIYNNNNNTAPSQQVTATTENTTTNNNKNQLGGVTMPTNQ